MTGHVPAWARSTWMISAWLVALTAVAYAPVRHFGYVPFDDQVMIHDEPHVRAGLTADSVRWALTSVDFGPWMPLQRLSYLADRQWFGLNTAVMHTEDVALHATAVVFLFLFLVEATGAVARSAVAAALFAVHPIHVESVAWLAERRDVQCLSLFTASLWAYARYVHAARRPGRRAFYVAAVLLFAGAVVGKATAMGGPILLLLVDGWPLRRRPPLTDRAGWRGALLEKVPFAAVAVPVAAVAAYGQHAMGLTSSLSTMPVPARVANALVTTVLYVQKLLVPTRLSAMYLPPAGGWPPAEVVTAAVGLAVAAGLAHRFRRRWPYFLFGLTWLVIGILPVSGAAQAGYQSMADRYSYLPSIGVTVAVVWAAADLAAHRAALGRLLATTIALTAIVLSTVMCRRQVMVWQDGRHLFAHAAAVTDDNWFAEYQLGLCDVGDRDYRSATARFTRVLQLNPDYPNAWIDLGNCTLLTDPGRAVDLYRQAIALSPDRADAARAYADLGNAYLLIGRPADAVAALSRALQCDPTSDYARHRLADATRGARD